MGTSPPGPLRCGSTTWSVRPVATAASKAFPPSSRTAIPTAEASQCVEATIPKVPRSSGLVVNIRLRPPVLRAACPPLRGFFGELFRLVVRGSAARDERRLQLSRDRLLGDRALDHVVPRRQLEHDVEQRGLDDRAQAAGAGL